MMANKKFIPKNKKSANTNLLNFDIKARDNILMLTERIKRLREKTYMLEYAETLHNLYFFDEDLEGEEVQNQLKNYLDFYK